MIRKLILLLSLALLANALACGSKYTDPDDIIVPDATSPVQLADPFIMLDGDTYYAYGTHADAGIEVFTSNDLKEWTYKGLALQSKDVWADRWFWAPEVYKVNGKYYMYYSADEHICAAVSDSPLGPFTQKNKAPMITDEKCIDNSLFIDDDGKPYLIFDRFNGGLNINVAELEDDLLTIKRGTVTPCIHMSQSWEKVYPTVNEGGFVIKHKGLYYMIYSANSYESPSYGIGCATAEKITGPWTKYEENPILQFPGNLQGVGHGTIFKDKEGQLRIVYHSHWSKTSIHPRIMHIGKVSFENVGGVDRMRISKDYITPEQKH